MTNGLKILLSVWLLWAVTTAIAVPLLWDSGYREFSGKEIFNSNEEYTQFKEAVAAPNLTILHMIALSSEPPIVVDFKVETRNLKLDFPYGTDETDADWPYVFIGLAVPIIGSVMWLGSRP